MFSDNMPGFTPPTYQEEIEHFNNKIKKKDEKIKQLEAENRRLRAEVDSQLISRGIGDHLKVDVEGMQSIILHDGYGLRAEINNGVAEVHTYKL